MTQTIEPMADNIYLGGDFAPVDSEVLATDLEVIGAVPPELEGRYIRNGPNPIGDVDPASHWFSGPGMVHGVRLRGGGAEWYRNRWVAGNAVTDALGRPEVPGPPRHAQSSPNTNVSGFAGTTWALVEGGSPPAELDYDLATIRRNDFFGTLPNGFSAHPKVDPATGDMHAMCHSWGELADHIEYVVIGSEGRVKHIAEVPLPGMSMVHDMSITESFPFRWNPGYGARIGLMPLGGAAEAIIWCDVSLCYVYHVLNAYDAPDGTVVIDVCRYDKMFDRDVYGPAGDCLPTLDRWTVDPKRRTVREERIDDRFHEFPRVRHDRTGRFHRFGYTAAVGEHFAPGSTYKHDLATGTLTEHDHGPGRGTAEPAFVARPGGTDEDDGWLLSYVSDRAAGRSELVILDARDMTEQPVARVLLPARVPAGFHGNWIPDTGVNTK